MRIFIYLAILFFIKNYSYIVLYLCFIIVILILIIKSLSLRLRLYVVLLVYMRGVLLILFYFTLILNVLDLKILRVGKSLLLGVIVSTLRFKNFIPITLRSYAVEYNLGVLLSFIIFLGRIILYFMVILNYFHKIKFLRQFS